MAWIKSDQRLRLHPKLSNACKLLQTRPAPLVGHIHFLWWWALDYAEDGDLSEFSPEVIAGAAAWTKNPTTFVNALVESGFLDQDSEGRLFIHDWMNYAGSLVEARNKQRQRDVQAAVAPAVKQRDAGQCRYCGIVVNWQDRRGPTGGTYDHIDPAAGATMENIVVACRSCNSRKGQRDPAEAKMELLPEPDLDLTGIRPRPDTENKSRVERTREELNPLAQASPPQVEGTAGKTSRETSGEPRPEAPSPSVPEPPGFARWYAVYPLHQGRGAAAKAYRNARQRAPEDVLLAAAVRYASDPNLPTDRSKIPYPQRWLNEKRWLDEPLPERSNGQADPIAAWRASRG